MFYRRQTKNAVNYSFTTFCDFFQVVPPGNEHLYFYVHKWLTTSLFLYLEIIETTESALHKLLLISTIHVIIFLTLQR